MNMSAEERRAEDYRSGTELRGGGSSARTETRLMILVVVVGIVLLAVKLVAYFVTGSAAVYSDALEGSVNVVAGLFGLYAIWLAHRPADPDHPYGHGKVEFFSAGLEGAMILLAALATMVKSVGVLVGNTDSVQTQGLGLGIVLVAAAMAVNGLLGGILIREGGRRGSPTLHADGWHLVGDAVTSGVALTALLVVWMTGWEPADPILAIGVSLLIGWTGLRLLRRSFDGLMDRSDNADNVVVRAILENHVTSAEPRICGYHKVRSRHTGRYHWVDFHLFVPASWDVQRGHEAASAIEYEIEQALGEGNATAHVEPCSDARCAPCRLAAGPLAMGSSQGSGPQTP